MAVEEDVAMHINNKRKADEISNDDHHSCAVINDGASGGNAGQN